jgi:tetratricopeptide (TPR) repeat protein
MKTLAPILSLFALLLPTLLLGTAVAEEEAPTEALKRGFHEGKFVDEYFGITYEVDGLKEGFGFGSGGNRILFSGKLSSTAEVEILCNEDAEELTSAEWRDKAKAQMEKDGKTRTDMATGDEPTPWITFVQESFAGFERPHGYAFFARGRQCFVVHVQVREKSDASAEMVRKGLDGLTIEPSSDSLLHVHIIAKGMRLDLDHPKVLVQAGQSYMQEGSENRPLAMRALELAQAREDELDDAGRYLLYQTLAMAQLTGGKREAAVGTWKKVIELAAKTENAGAAVSLAQYNLACTLSLLGRVDEGFTALEAAFSGGPEDGLTQLKEHAQQDPDLENLRAHTRWAEVAGTAGGG